VGLRGTQPAQGAGVTDTEIRIGNIMPYTGPLAAFASIGRAEAAYFDMINERGGINGRKIRFISRDDSSNPKTAVEHTSELVEQERVHLMFGSFGTPSNWRREPISTREISRSSLSPPATRNGRTRSGSMDDGLAADVRAEGGSTPITSRPPIPARRSPCCGRTTQFGRDLFRGCRRGSHYRQHDRGRHRHRCGHVHRCQLTS